MTEKKETRFVYGEALLALGQQRSDIVALDADLYNSTRSIVFGKAFPDRFFDLGIAEQDLVSTAAGISATGLIPFCNSFAIFLTGRAYDQIRTQVCYPALPVKLAGSSAGLTLGADGASHQSLDDITLMRALPNMTVIVPADDIETWQATHAAAELPGPVYIRLGRYPVPRVHPNDYQFKLGEVTRLREGQGVVLLATGHMVWKALEAAELLAAEGVEARVCSVGTIKPLKTEAVLREVAGIPAVITVEEHSIIGGLGSAVAEILMEARAGALAFKRLGVRDEFGESGTADEMLTKHRLQPDSIAVDVAALLQHV
jgi:transketolase